MQMVSQLPLLADTKLFGGLRTFETDDRRFVVSLVCVTRNAADYLPSLLQSVRAHKDFNVELIIADGDSSDGTVEILRNNGDIIDYWFSRPDNGIYDAMNKALSYVKGEWVIFMGADDHLLGGFTGMVNELKDPDTIYYGNLMFYGKGFVKKYDDYYLTKLNICQQCIFYPVSVFNRYIFDTRYKVYADYHLNIRCWHDPQFTFQHVDRMVAWFSDGGYSSFTKDPAFERDRDMLFKKYLKPASYYRYLNRTLGFFRMLTRFIQNK